MIGFLRGRLLAKHPPALTVDVNGVGYELEAPMSTFYDLPAAGGEVQLFTHLVVREDAQVLYGFATDAERRLFRTLLKVSGVGPKMALGILSGISVEGFARCVEAQDAASLVRIPGVGRKTAERLLIEMRDRLQSLATVGEVARAQSGQSAAHGEAFSALVSLGYKPLEVARLLKAADGGDGSTEDLIRRALQAAVRD
ncbi:MAG TPA: Holliday junction branch migration protein RuvA [Steroidobacteraceae bacterium]|nr:Holliday junction branch migration protein RuvA [Steroidobacteraceae bacterium]